MPIDGKRTPEADLPRAQRERLAYVELLAWFTGGVGRPDIEARFGVKPAAATRDLSAYREAAPGNLEYDTATRRYRPTEGFRPLFGFSTERVLSWVASGFGEGLDPRPDRPFPCEGPIPVAGPDLAILAAVSRAICGRRPLRILYRSMSSGTSERVIVPVALADTGQRWHARAYDRKNGRFSDFALRRIEAAEPLAETAGEGESIRDDGQWARLVDLEMVPHPKALWPEAVAADHAMVDGALRVRTRAALAGYFLRRWGVDCSPGGDLDPAEHHLRLENPDALEGVESATLAPGMGRGRDENTDKNTGKKG